jgi:Rps23 Pro-64 3,4-dihydroxylase Tpa1-like proline 4-hydroxylase
MTTTKATGFLAQDVLSDDSILGSSERELISSLIERARTSLEPNERHLPNAIARLAGEIIAERVYGNLGSDIGRLLLERTRGSSPGRIPINVDPASPPAAPPMSAPRTPAPNPPKGISSAIRMGPGPQPPIQGPRTPGPNPPASIANAVNSTSSALATSDLRETMAAQCVVFEEFLAPEELQNLMQDTLNREMEFQISEVISPGVTGGAVDFEYRRSQVLMDTGRYRDVILNRLQSCLPRVFQKLGLQSFWPTRAEVQITASNHADFFRCHSDNGHEELKSRELTFVYFFHREPKTFQGGELRLYDSQWDGQAYVATENYRAIVPRQNQIVLFPSSLTHEITPVECPSKAFADSRFTVNGWLHR